MIKAIGMVALVKAFLWVTTAVCAEENDTGVVVPPFKFSGALPVVKAMAEREGIPFERVGTSSEAESLQIGDSVTALVTLTHEQRLEQWIVSLTCVELTEKEKKPSPKKGLHMHTSAGTEIVFREDRAAVVARVLGPYKKAADLKESLKDAKDVSARMTVNAEYLSLGLDRACEAVLGLRENLQENPGLRRPKWEVGPKRFSKERVERDGKLAGPVGLTPERERAVAGAVPALMEFWRLASRTPGLQEITRSMAQVSWWSIVMKGGETKARLKPHLARAYPIKLEGNVGERASGYGFPFELWVNDRPALSCQAMVVGARPPLLPCAGILVMAVQAPDGKGPHLMISVVDARSKARVAEVPSLKAGTP